MPTICKTLDELPMQFYAAALDLRHAADRFEQTARLLQAGRLGEAEKTAALALQSTERGIEQIPGWA